MNHPPTPNLKPITQMKTLSSLLTCCLMAASVFSQDNPAVKAIAATYSQIEKEHESWPHFTLSKTDEEGGGYVLERHVWISREEGSLAKAKVTDASEHGETITEYYLKDGKLIFVFKKTTNTPFLPDAKTSVVEQRLYFTQEMLIHALGKSGKVAPDKPADISSAKNQSLPLDKLDDEGINYATFQKQASTLVELLPQVMDDVSLAMEPEEAGEPVGEVQTLVGTFSGIEIGDYYHWTMKDAKGEPQNFFIWSGGEEIDKIAENADKFVGKKCRVTWQKMKRNIRENGGETEIDEVLKFEWIE